MSVIFVAADAMSAVVASAWAIAATMGTATWNVWTDAASMQAVRPLCGTSLPLVRLLQLS